MDPNFKNLIDKYYNGETSLQEEELLRNSLTCNEDLSDDLYSSLIFKTFVEEKKEQAPDSLQLLPQTIPFHRKCIINYKKCIYATAGVAACLAVIFTVFFHQTKASNDCAYVIINGVRIDDEKLALKYIQESFEEEERINKIELELLQEMLEKENEMNTIANNMFNFKN